MRTRIWALICMVLMVAGCVRPTSVPQLAAAKGDPSQLAGRVDLAALAGRTRQVQSQRSVRATMPDVAAYATVSLIDSGTNQTIASTVTDGSGNFSLSAGNFTPTAGRTYYVEAVKGLLNNVPGNKAARVRTLVGWSGGWNSLTGATAYVDRSTTALSVIVSLRGLTANPVNGGSLLGALVPGVPDTTLAPTTDDNFAAAASNVLPGVSEGEFHQVYAAVADVLANNGDPVAGALINTQVNAASPWYSYFEAAQAFQVNSLTPSSGPLGTQVTLLGSNFSPTPANDVVKFNGAQATVVGISSDLSQLVVKVPPGATTGPVSVQIGTAAGVGPTFVVTSGDGHNVFDASGNQYVAGSNGYVYTLSPAGVLTQFASGFNRPTAVALDGAGNVYLADGGANAVYKLTPAGASSSFATGLNNPSGLALDTAGNLYVSNQGAGTVSEISPAGVVTTPVSGLSGPCGLAFDPNNGNLYIANNYNNSVAKFAGGVLTTYAVGFNSPRGLAVDTWGNVYVANYNGSEVFKISTSGAVSTFASRYSHPQSLAFDAYGNLYLSTFNNNLYRLSPTAVETQLATAFSNPWSLAVDASGRLVGAGHDDNKLSRAVGAAPAQNFANINAPNGIATDSAGNLYVASQGNIIYKVSGSGAVSTFAQLNDVPLGLAVDAGGNVYAAGQNARGVWKFNAAGANLGLFWPSTNNESGQIATDSAGNIYWCNGWLNSNVQFPGQYTGDVARYDGTRITPMFQGQPGLMRGVAVDGSNNVYASTEAGTVYKSAGGVVTTFASVPNARGMVWYGGNLYVCQYSGSVARVSASGAVSTYATGMNSPMQPTVDPWGNLYLTDYNNGNIYKLPYSSTTTTPVVYASGLSNPWAIAFDSSLNLLVGNLGDSTLRKIATGSVAMTTLTSNVGVYGLMAAGTGIYFNQWGAFSRLDANLNRTDLSITWGGYPQGLAFDGAGNLWISHSSAYMFQVNPAGASQFYSNWICDPFGVTTDSAGNAYVVAQGYGCGSGVAKFTPGATASATWLRWGLNLGCGLAMDPSGTALLVSEQGQHDIKRLNLSTNTFGPTPYYPYNPSF